MSDIIVGTSVLQPSWVPNIFYLWFTAQKANSHRMQGNIFIAEEGVHIPAKFPGYPDGCNTIWKFRRHGKVLACCPSVNWISAGFHNSFNWQTDFVEMITVRKEHGKGGEEQSGDELGSHVHYELNLLPVDERKRTIQGLKEMAVLK